MKTKPIYWRLLLFACILAICGYVLCSSILHKRAIFLTERGELYIQQNRFVEARQALEEATRIWPEFALGHIDLAEVLIKQGACKGAIVELQRALRLSPSELRPSVYFRLGLAYDCDGQRTEAQAAWTEVLKYPDAQDRAAARKLLDRVPNSVDSSTGTGL